MGVIINNITWWRIKLDDEVPPVSLPLTSSERDGLLASSPEYKTKENSNNYFPNINYFRCDEFRDQYLVSRDGKLDSCLFEFLVECFSKPEWYVHLMNTSEKFHSFIGWDWRGGRQRKLIFLIAGWRLDILSMINFSDVKLVVTEVTSKISSCG